LNTVNINLTDEQIYGAVMAAAKAMDEKFASDILILDIREVSLLSDYFIIATANNDNIARAVVREVDEALTKQGITLRHTEGTAGGGWMLMDFGVIVIHLFGIDEREFFAIERIWSDATRIEWSPA